MHQMTQTELEAHGALVDHYEKGGQFTILRAYLDGVPVAVFCNEHADGTARPLGLLLKEEQLCRLVMEDGSPLCEPDDQQH